MAKKVIVYWAEWCIWCHKLMDFLKQHNVPFEARNVDEGTYGKEAAKKSGQMGVPVTVIDETVVVGFDEKKLKELLQIE